MPTPEEWKTANAITVIEYLLKDMNVLIPHGLFHVDIGIILSLFLGFMKRPIHEFKPEQLAPLHTEWGKRRPGILKFFQQPIDQTQLHPIFKQQDNTEVLHLWIEWPAHWRCLHAAILRADRNARSEQAKVKSGCKCASKPKPPAFHHWGNQIYLYNALAMVFNQFLNPFLAFWRKVPLPAVPIVLDNVKNAVVLPLAEETPVGDGATTTELALPPAPVSSTL